MPDTFYGGPGGPRRNVDMGSNGGVTTWAEEMVARDPALLRTITSNTLTRQADTTSYAAGQIVGGDSAAGFTNNGLTFSNFARIAGGMVRLDRARLYKSQANASGLFELSVFRGQPTITVGDAGAFASGVPIGVASPNSRLVARFVFDMTSARVGSDGAEMAAIPVSNYPAIVGLPSNGTDLFGILTANSAYAPQNAETFTVVLEGIAF